MSTPHGAVDYGDFDVGTCNLGFPSARSVNHGEIPLIGTVAASPRATVVWVVVCYEQLRQGDAFGVFYLGERFKSCDELVDAFVLCEFEADDALGHGVVEGVERTGDEGDSVLGEEVGVLFHLGRLDTSVFVDHKSEIVAVYELEVQMPINVVGIQRLCSQPHEGEA